MEQRFEDWRKQQKVVNKKTTDKDDDDVRLSMRKMHKRCAKRQNDAYNSAKKILIK